MNDHDNYEPDFETDIEEHHYDPEHETETVTHTHTVTPVKQKKNLDMKKIGLIGGVAAIAIVGFVYGKPYIQNKLSGQSQTHVVSHRVPGPPGFNPHVPGDPHSGDTGFNHSPSTSASNFASNSTTPNNGAGNHGSAMFGGMNAPGIGQGHPGAQNVPQPVSSGNDSDPYSHAPSLPSTPHDSSEGANVASNNSPASPGVVLPAPVPSSSTPEVDTSSSKLTDVLNSLDKHSQDISDKIDASKTDIQKSVSDSTTAIDSHVDDKTKEINDKLDNLTKITQEIADRNKPKPVVAKTIAHKYHKPHHVLAHKKLKNDDISVASVDNARITDYHLRGVSKSSVILEGPDGYLNVPIGQKPAGNAGNVIGVVSGVEKNGDHWQVLSSKGTIVE